MQTLMKCGCTTTAIRNRDGAPVCITHYGLTPDAEVVSSETPDLTGRRARCSYFRSCGREVDSNLDLAFFVHHPDSEYDAFYCGCYGWD